MTSIFHKPRSLPLSHNPTQDPPAGIRRRISTAAMSFQIQPPTISATTAWAFRSSKSVSSMGETASTSVRNWWNLGWEWILSRKPVFAEDLEMNPEESSVLGCHNKGSWRHILYKFRSEIRKLVGSGQPGLPQTIRSGSFKSAI
ncbi:hypothetical protein SSX86_015881 [Deinandra increscens subsp. villosa]|uniref:Uncharacterized protein n=1 Tax=Deinandra increscens subsp. villosa TaxID=3103831 RepID=A0AAP0GXK4_9ASTR